MNTHPFKQILVAPLDWGLGHTTRCLPIIRHLQELGHTDLFAGNEWQRSFVMQTFPELLCFQLKGYEVSYSKHAAYFLPHLFLQTPKILKAIKEEKKWLQDFVKQQKIDGIISDNRYGLHHPTIPSVIICHQLQIKTGLGNVVDDFVQKIHARLLQRCSNVWVPDVADENNLAGLLAHPKKLPSNTAYIGWLSQFYESEIVEEKHLLILLSGEETQRAQLSDLLWQEVQNFDGKVVFVAGSDAEKRTNIPLHIDFYNRLSAAELLPLLQAANYVICRSGYSSIMDLVALQKKAILLPTPSQTEQEYLAKHLHKNGVFYAASQKNFKLKDAIHSANNFPFKKIGKQESFHQFIPVLNNWLSKL